MNEKRLDDFTVRNARIIFRNFSGKGSDFNREGDRNFALVIDDEDFRRDLIADGWNVKTWLRNRGTDEEEPVYYIPVSVKYHIDDGYEYLSPKIYKVIAGGNPIELDHTTVGDLDYDEIKNVDLTISPSRWNVNGATGIKAYVKKMYVTISQDELDAIYNNRDYEAQ